MARTRRGDSISQWAKDASCRTVKQDFWFPTKPGDEEQAKAICATCPVFDDCRAHADNPETRELYGIWAGETPSERGDRRRKERVKAERARNPQQPLTLEQMAAQAVLRSVR